MRDNDASVDREDPIGQRVQFVMRLVRRILDYFPPCDLSFCGTIAVAAALPEIASTYFGTGGLLGGGVLDGAATGAIAGTTSQVFGVATGIQDHFDFASVALDGTIVTLGDGRRLVD